MCSYPRAPCSYPRAPRSDPRARVLVPPRLRPAPCRDISTTSNGPDSRPAAPRIWGVHPRRSCPSAESERRPSRPSVGGGRRGHSRTPQRPPSPPHATAPALAVAGSLSATDVADEATGSGAGPGADRRLAQKPPRCADRARQGPTGHGRARQGTAGHGRARQGPTGHGRARQGTAGHDREAARSGNSSAPGVSCRSAAEATGATISDRIGVEGRSSRSAARGRSSGRAARPPSRSARSTSSTRRGCRRTLRGRDGRRPVRRADRGGATEGGGALPFGRRRGGSAAASRGPPAPLPDGRGERGHEDAPHDEGVDQHAQGDRETDLEEDQQRRGHQ